MKNWLTPEEFDSEYNLVWGREVGIKRRDGKKLELARDSQEPSYKEIIEELKTKAKDMIPDGLFVYPFSGHDTLTSFGSHCIMIDTLEYMTEDEIKHVKKTVKEPDNLDFIRADWRKPPLKEELEYNLIFKRSSDKEEDVEYELKSLASKQLIPKSVILFNGGYYDPLFRRLRRRTGYKDEINGYKVAGIFSIRPEIREVLQNPNGSVSDTVIIYSRIDGEKKK
ncbi:MAG: hypothetical protein GTN36_04545 [Candidatus Aenigmarchaeota archaeon]|nr:hypothetical protein [Candidatus Aenigmarchaeota archaeon]